MKKIFKGFSLMEMMVVMLIVAVVMAATAPMISKKMIASQASSTGSPWLWNDAHIFFNPNANSVTAMIGTNNPNTNPDKPKLLIKSKDEPQIGLIAPVGTGHHRVNLTFTADDGFGVTSKPLGSRSTSVGFISDASGDHSVSYGYAANATAANSSAYGYAANASALNSTALGVGARAEAEHATAVGRAAKALANFSSAFGFGANASELNTAAFGYGANAPAVNATALGVGAKALAENATATGRGAQADKVNSVAIGALAHSWSDNSISIGRSSHDSTGAGSQHAISIGTVAQALSDCAIAIGSGYQNSAGSWTDVTQAKGSHSVAIGSGAYVKDDAFNSVAIGYKAHANSDRAIAIGGFWHRDDSTSYTRATGPHSIAIGGKALASKTDAVAIGTGAQATADYSVAIGTNAEATKAHTIVLGAWNGLWKDVVHIKGDLVVDGNVYLGRNPGSKVYMRLNDLGDSNGYNGNIFAHIYKDNSAMTAAGVSGCGSLYDGSAYSTAIDKVNTLVSDRRLKNVGDVYKGGLAELRKLNFYHYTFKKDESKTPRVGVMAQDLQKVFPDAVIKGEDGFLRIRLEDMFYAVINAVKELDARLTALAEDVKSNIDVISKLQDKVTSQEKQIAELKKQNAEFEKQNTEFEKRIAKLEKIGKLR